MTWQTALTHPAIVLAGAVWVWVWKTWSKELTELFKNGSINCWQWLFRREAARRAAEQKILLSMGLGGLQTLLYLIRDDYSADRVTVFKYEFKDGGHWGTCVGEARLGDMQSVEYEWQQRLADPTIWEEIEQIHLRPGRWKYVPDVRLLDVPALRDVLLNSGVWSAFYHSLPNSTNKAWAVLAVSWHTERRLTPEELKNLHASGVACATVLLITEQANKPTKK